MSISIAKKCTDIKDQKHMMIFFKVSKSLCNDVKSMICDIACLAGNKMYKVNYFDLLLPSFGEFLELGETLVFSFLANILLCDFFPCAVGCHSTYFWLGTCYIAADFVLWP